MEPVAHAQASAEGRKRSVVRALACPPSPTHERLVALHPPPDRDLAARDRHHARRDARLYVAAGLLAAAGRFPHHSGHDPASGRQPRRDGVAGDGAARAQFRADSFAPADDVFELVRHQPDHAAVRAQPRHRCGCAGHPGGDQCFGSNAAEKSALPAGLFQGEPRRCADGDAGDHLRHHLAARAQRRRRHPAGAAAERTFRRWARHRPRQYPTCHPHPGGPVSACQLRHLARGPAQRDHCGECRRAKGALDGAHQSYTIAANDQLTAADAYRNIIVTYRNTAPVLLRDVADVVDGLENSKVAGFYQGMPAVVVDIQRQPGANVIETVRRINNELPKLQRSMPIGATLTVVHDATASIRASVRDVQFTLILSVALVITVVLIFLRTIRATIIAGVALPLSLIATFGIMWFCGFSLDNLSLMALTIGTGFVVDDAIVMIENIVRHMENGEEPFQ